MVCIVRDHHHWHVWVRLLEAADDFEPRATVDVQQTVHDDQRELTLVEKFSRIDLLMRRIDNGVEMLIEELRKCVVIRPTITDLENSLGY